MTDDVIIEYEGPVVAKGLLLKRESAIARPKLYGAYVLFHDTDAEPLGVEKIIDFEDRAEVFFMVDAEGNRWFIPWASVRWVEVTPMEAL